MKAAFIRRSPREKLLIVVLVMALALVWLITATSRLGRHWGENRTVTAQLDEQSQWLDRRAEIEQRSAAAVANLDPSRTLDATHLVGEVVTLAENAGLSPAIDSPRSQQTGPFSYHTVEVSFRRVELAALVAFYRELGERAPYVALEEVTLAADRGNPALINASFAVFSVEVSP